jgi:hypothetical protein
MAIIRNKEYSITKNLSHAEKELGVDLKLSPNGDIEISNLKDLKLVAGVENAAQALRLKLEIEKGSLPYHPNIGTSLQIGEKTKDAFAIKVSAISSILADPRFVNARVNVSVTGGVYILDLYVTLKGADFEVPLQLALVN